MSPIVLANPNKKYPDKPSGPKTEKINWRGGSIEFCRENGCGFNSTAPAKPPWYVVRCRGGTFNKEWWYLWIDYAGPPEVFLTRKMAEKRAKDFREQYGGGKQYDNGPLKVEVVKINP